MKSVGHRRDNMIFFGFWAFFLTYFCFPCSTLALEGRSLWTAERLFSPVQGMTCLRQPSAKEGAVKRIEKELTAKDGAQHQAMTQFIEALDEFENGEEESLTVWETTHHSWHPAEAQERFDLWISWLNHQQRRFVDWGRGGILPHSNEALALQSLMERFLGLMDRTALLFEKHGLNPKEPLGLSYIQAGNFYHFLLGETWHAAALYQRAPRSLQSSYFERPLFQGIQRAWEKREALRKVVRQSKNTQTAQGIRKLGELIGTARHRKDPDLEDEVLNAIAWLGRRRHHLEEVRSAIGELLYTKYPLSTVVFDYLMAAKEDPRHRTWVELPRVTSDHIHILPGIGGLITGSPLSSNVEYYLRNHREDVLYLSDFLHMGSPTTTIPSRQFKQLIQGTPEDLTNQILRNYKRSIATSAYPHYRRALWAYVDRMLELLPQYGVRQSGPIYQTRVPRSIIQGLLTVAEDTAVPFRDRLLIRERLAHYEQKGVMTPTVRTFLKQRLAEAAQDGGWKNPAQESHFINVSRLVHDVVTESQPLAVENDILLILNDSPETLRTEGTLSVHEPIDLEQWREHQPPPFDLKDALLEILPNAILYSKGYGKMVTVTLHSEKDDIVIEVKDDGIGIPEEELPMISRKVYRGRLTRNKEGGFGKGLVRTRQLIEETFQGSLSIESTGEGKGTLVTVRLPKYATEEEDLGLLEGTVQKTIRGLIQNEKGEILLLRIQQGSQAGKWEIAGGKVEPGENMETAFIREAQEEAGIKIDIDALHYSPYLGIVIEHLPTATGLRDVHAFRLHVKGNPHIQISEEHTEYRWVPIATLKAYPLTYQTKRVLLYTLPLDSGFFNAGNGKTGKDGGRHLLPQPFLPTLYDQLLLTSP